MEISRIAAHSFTNEQDITFSPLEYSQFKFGSKSIARKFGKELAMKFISSEQFTELVDSVRNTDRRIIVMSSPYVHVPTATFAMKNYFVSHLNRALYAAGIKPVLETKIHRALSYKEDYGEMSREQRDKTMCGDHFRVDAELLRGNACIYLDDIVITGAHERRVVKMLQKYGIEDGQNYFLYFAELTDENTDPKIENFLNYYFIKNLIRLNKIIENHEFVINTRVVKYILHSKHDECCEFLMYQSESLLMKLYDNAIGNGYNTVADYSENFKFLEEMVAANDKTWKPKKLK